MISKTTIFPAVLAAAIFLAPAGAPTSSAQTAGLLESPALITSAGQSGDAPIATVLFKKAEIPATYEKLATAKSLENQKTLVLVIGASLKGLGAAGLDVGKENERLAGLVAEAKKKNIAILCLHVGGEARRGDLTDEMAGAYIPAAKAALVVKSGNKDGLFTKICQAGNIPLVEVEKTLDAVEPLKKLFGK
jgi:hypothetical protein